jgi:hypothetical protein
MAVTLRSELERHGYLGDIACSSDLATGYPLGAHFEVRILTLNGHIQPSIGLGAPDNTD